MRVLITGILGSGGRLLTEWIRRNHPEVEVHGLARRVLFSNVGAVVHFADLLDFSSVVRVLEDACPDVIFHLAANADVRSSFMTPLAVLDNNIRGTAVLLDAVLWQCGCVPTIVLCSSSEVYGQVREEDVPIKESCPMRPVSPYAASKACQEMIALSYFRSFGLKVVVTRAFTYINPYRTNLFATSFARQIALIEAGKQEVLTHGNLDSVRTLMTANDCMAAYWTAAQKGVPGEAYNIGGSNSMSVGEVLLTLCGMSYKAPIPTKDDPALLRPADVTLQIPDCTKFRVETGWEPKDRVEESLEGLLNYWRERIKE